MDGLSHQQLAELCREHLLAGHLIDRAGMPTVLGEHGQEIMEQVAIEEWMAASPIYSRRIQRLLGFGPGAGSDGGGDGDGDVATIFKGMQLDIGAPPEFMDFRYTVHDEHHGEFWLASCGALLDVEPMGEAMVTGMCHHIEDPTFDATAAASHPHAQVRPIHRPPRSDEQKAARVEAASVGEHQHQAHAHCHWTVTIDPSGDPLAEPEVAKALRTASRAARHPVPVPVPLVGAHDGAGVGAAAPGGSPPPAVGGGWRWDYHGELDPELRLGSFARPVLEAMTDEVCLQGHLLSQAFARAVASRCGEEAAEQALLAQFTGIAGLTSQRLARWLAGQAVAGQDRGTGPLSATPVRVVSASAMEVHEGSTDARTPASEETSSSAGGDGALSLDGQTAMGRGSAGTIDVVADVLALHPAFRPPGYVDLRVRRAASADAAGAGTAHDDAQPLLVQLHPSPALEEPYPSWIGLLAAGHDRPLEAAVRGVEPRAEVRRVDPGGGAVAAWAVTVDPGAEPLPPHDEVVLASFSTGADFVFRRSVL